VLVNAWASLRITDHRRGLIGSNSVAFTTNRDQHVKHITMSPCSPEAFGPDGKELWWRFAARTTLSPLMADLRERPGFLRRPPGHDLFPPNNKYGYVCSSFKPVTD